MIIQWKQEGPLLYRAAWQNMHLALGWDYGISKWRVWVNGDRTKQQYDSADAAKAGVDVIVGKLLSNGPVVPVEQVEQPKLTMQGLISIMASIAVVRRRQAAQDYTPQGARSDRITGGAPSLTEVERA